MRLFDDYNYEEPRRLTELHPVRTMEAGLVGTMSFPMKVKYDLVKRTRPFTIIRPAESYMPGDAEDLTVGGDEPTAGITPTIDERGDPNGIDEEGPPDTGGAASSGGLLPPDGVVKSGDAEAKKRYFKTDAIG